MNTQPHIRVLYTNSTQTILFTQLGVFTMERTITTGFMDTAMGNFAITKTIEEISTDEYMSMILSNRDILSEQLVKDIFFEGSKAQRFRVIK